MTRVGSGGNKLRCEPTFCNSGMWKIETQFSRGIKNLIMIYLGSVCLVRVEIS